ncbi:hypothetical protein [Notoacmeibacter sp. MSK16QG-6]|uniref:hypothetical protein n=1 Tax=Notoacmeibacter sp. MSK16QG-6 TaxID=2957982 RepID=UPI00209E577F|nr:hypothetical protein [Notoacmeibacter sp. MSK16QG-6]MCP1199907.1 hypothetical protein [Notoacmeibacter sp. MSK16QG-6]
MDEQNDRPAGDPVRKRRLSDAIREVKNAVADRSDILGDLREARQARIDLLVQELQPLIDDIPAEDDLFDLAVSSGVEPRFWIDAVAHVHIGRDGRSYCFVRDLRRGREVVAEATDVREMAEYVTFYIAERMVERERLQMEGISSIRPMSPNLPRTPERSDDRDKEREVAVSSEPASGSSPPAPADEAVEPEPEKKASRSIWITILLALIVILLGMAVGFVAIALFVAPDLLRNLLSSISA